MTRTWKKGRLESTGNAWDSTQRCLGVQNQTAEKQREEEGRKEEEVKENLLLSGAAALYVLLIITALLTASPGSQSQD